MAVLVSTNSRVFSQTTYHIDQQDYNLIVDSIVLLGPVDTLRHLAFNRLFAENAIYVVHGQSAKLLDEGNILNNSDRHIINSVNDIEFIVERQNGIWTTRRDISSAYHAAFENYCNSIDCIQKSIGNDSTVFVTNRIEFYHFGVNELENIKIKKFKKNSLFNSKIDSFYILYSSVKSLYDTGNIFFNTLMNQTYNFSGNKNHVYTERLLDYDKIPSSVDLEITISNNFGKAMIFRITEMTIRPVQIEHYDKILYDLYSYKVNGHKLTNVNRLVIDKNMLDEKK